MALDTQIGQDIFAERPEPPPLEHKDIKASCQVTEGIVLNRMVLGGRDIRQDAELSAMAALQVPVPRIDEFGPMSDSRQ